MTSELPTIEPGVIYPLRAFEKICGLGRHGMRTARRNGLKVTYSGNRGFVNGTDFIDYLRDKGQSSPSVSAVDP